MTENQKIWLEALIKEHRAVASNERVWARGYFSDEVFSDELVHMHEDNAEEHEEFANMLTTLLES